MAMFFTFIPFIAADKLKELSSVGSVYASYASDPQMDPHAQVIFLGEFLHVLLIQEEQVVSYWQQNGH